MCIMIHLGKEIAGVIKSGSSTVTTHKTESKIPLGETLVRMIQLLAVSGLVSFCVCVGLASGLSFCNYLDGDNLKCLQSLRTLAKILTNPAHFPLTISAVIPVMILLATNQNLFRKSETCVSRRVSWGLFIILYSLFLVDLILFSRAEIYSEDGALLVVPDPLQCQWRQPCGSMLRNLGIFLVCVFL